MALTMKKTDDDETFNVTTCSIKDLHDCKYCSFDYPLGLDQVMNYPFIFSKSRWSSMSDECISNLRKGLNKLPVKKRHLYKAYYIIGTEQRLKTVWDAEEERFKCLRKGEWAYIVGTEELCYNIKMLHNKMWNLSNRLLSLYNAVLKDKDTISKKVYKDIKYNRTGNADGRARKVKHTKTVNVYMT